MYEKFGAIVDQSKKSVSFKLFIPNQSDAPTEIDTSSGITRVSVVGTFQAPEGAQWDTDQALPLRKTVYKEPRTKKPLGTLYSLTLKDLPDGFYEYKYWVEFEGSPPRLLTDPCARYGGTRHQNSGFVVGGQIETVKPLAKRLPLQDLVIYELMIDDFTANIREADEAPLQTIVKKLDELQELGINAIEFMPWTAWSSKVEEGDDIEDNFSWGYDPVQYFAAAHKYTLNKSTPTDKLFYLKRLINECHQRGIHVIMDAVLNHADGSSPERGFPYFWLYQNPDDSPYVGEFEEHDYFQDLDYANRCTLEYIRDACFYWIDEFQIDGFRLDNTLGYYREGDESVGLAKLLSEIKSHLKKARQENFSLTIEHSWDFDAIDAVNKVKATSCWIDPFRKLVGDYLIERPEGVPQIEPGLMRLLDAGHNFAEGSVPTIYLENHDHRRLMFEAGGRDSWYLTQPYVIALFTSPGATLIYNGQEWGLDNDMPEEGDDRVIPRPLNWSLRTEEPGPKLIELYRTLIRLRHEYPALRSSNFYPADWDEEQTQFNEEGFGIDRDRNLVVYHRWGKNSQREVERFYIVLNFSPDPQSVAFNVQKGDSWCELLSGTPVKATDGRIETTVNPNWGAIYYRADSE